MAHVDVTPIYENTTMKAYYNDSNVLRGYYIAPIEGYVLHSNSYDIDVFDEVTGKPTGENVLGYISYPASIMVGYNYDFDSNPKQIYAVYEDDVPRNQIFNDDPDTK